jgi:hypothetical protein
MEKKEKQGHKDRKRKGRQKERNIGRENDEY